MSAKRIAVITIATLMIAGSSIARENEGRNKNHEKKGKFCERGGKSCQEQIEHRGRGIERIINNHELCAQLGITNDQIERLKDSKEELDEQRKDLIAEMKEMRKNQMALMQADELDKKAIMEAINKSGKLRTRMEKLRVKALFRVQDVLTKDQLSEIKGRMRKHMREERNNRHGKREGKGGIKNNKDRQGKRDRDQNRPR